MLRLVLALAFSMGCEGAAVRPRVEPEPPAPSPIPAPPPASAGAETPEWNIRHVRPCSEWAAAHLIVEGDVVVICDGHEMDAENAAFLRVRDSRWFETYEWPSHEPDDQGVTTLATRADGATLITHPRGTELRLREGGRPRSEQVFPQRVDRGAFAGERIVLVTRNHDTVWVERGAPRPIPAAPPARPAGFEVLEPMVERPEGSEDEAWLAFGRDGVGSYPRGLADVTAFESDAGTIAVSRTDANELSRARDDQEWARFAMVRHLDQGEQRWAKAWRDEMGRRVVRGHTYIGGCERAHIDVLVREVEGGGAEIWTAISGRRGAFSRALGPIPREARPVSEVAGDAYQGDPSIGSLR